MPATRHRRSHAHVTVYAIRVRSVGFNRDNIVYAPHVADHTKLAEKASESAALKAVRRV